MAQQTQGRFPAQPQQNPKPANCIKKINEQVQAITNLRNGKEIDKTIFSKEINQGEDESRGLGHEIENKKRESEKNKSEEKEHYINYELSNKASNEVTMAI